MTFKLRLTEKIIGTCPEKLESEQSKEAAACTEAL